MFFWTPTKFPLSPFSLGVQKPPRPSLRKKGNPFGPWLAIGLTYQSTVALLNEMFQLSLLKMANFSVVKLPNGANVCFHGFFWSSPSAYLPICSRSGGRGGAVANNLEGKWKVSLFLVAPPQAAYSSFC